MISDGSCPENPEDDDSAEYAARDRECCPPQLFTSVLLGFLACVLVTGGVFLAFHKWDHTWLLMSAIGVLLMAIGTILHCCSSSQNERVSSHRCKGGCGLGRTKPDSASNGTILTEQLLPLSNARSVSQLSLNMVPGYFPPLVFPANGPYGLEQHSSVVQNISKLVQHQQQLHLQSPPSIVSGSDSKSFILLPLPVDANAANIQNIVAAVCQLDANISDNNTESQTATDVSSQATETSVILPDNSPSDTPPASDTEASTTPGVKHVEVQTCSWVDVPPNGSEVVKSTGISAGTSTQEDVQFQSTVTDAPSGSNSPPTEVQSDRTQENAIQSIEEPVRRPVCDILTQSSVTIDIPCSERNELQVPVTEENVIEQEDHEPEGDSSEFVDSSASEVEDSTVVELSREPRPEVLVSLSLSSIRLSSALTNNLDDDSSSDMEDDRSSPPPSYDDVTQESSPPSLPPSAFGQTYGTL